MSKKKITIDFDSEQITIIYDGNLVLREPSVIVRKKSESPVLLKFGNDVVSSSVLPNNSYIVRPFSQGKIIDKVSARLLFKACISKIFGKSKYLDIFVNISSNLTLEEKNDIENAFISSGYHSVYLVPKNKVIERLLALNSFYCGVFIDNDITELVIADNGNIISSYTLAVSYSVIVKNLHDNFEKDHKIVVDDNALIGILKEKCSLFLNDETKITIDGYDSVTNNAHKLTICACDLFPTISIIYNNIVKLIQASIKDLDVTLARAIIKSGIVFCGEGTKINGFEEYFASRLHTPCLISNDVNIMGQLSNTLVNGNDEWIFKNVE